MTFLKHGDGVSYATCLIIGKPAGSSNHYIVEIHPTRFKPVYKNPVINIQIADVQNTTAVSTAMINLRRVAIGVKITGWVYNTVQSGTLSFATNSIVSDHCYIETDTIKIFDTTTGALTLPTGTDLTLTQKTRALEKKWMLEQLAYSGATNGKAHTLQWRGICDPTKTDYTKNFYHQKMSITSCEFDDDAGTEHTVLDSASSPTVMDVDKLGVSIELIWGDPEA
ncbi:MAG: hypothetical protein WC451_02585 [Patescibacteria group bacterium]